MHAADLVQESVDSNPTDGGCTAPPAVLSLKVRPQLAPCRAISRCCAPRRACGGLSEATSSPPNSAIAIPSIAYGACRDMCVSRHHPAQHIAPWEHRLVLKCLQHAPVRANLEDSSCLARPRLRCRGSRRSEEESLVDRAQVLRRAPLAADRARVLALEREGVYAVRVLVSSKQLGMHHGEAKGVCARLLTKRRAAKLGADAQGERVKGDDRLVRPVGHVGSKQQLAIR
mmetsp:Transcript_21612/g.71495  ORF Transcript_21612/g.71495 Transcript_21612/m.71495 type:complete len:229 (-) Transcript_21612:652-1338(-)